ncbi:hypothetical protein MKW92_017754 [Papaver armeniacum]|nr:hypothetical protein MKW92_017754 [Papaver armeniacum]
MQVYNGLDILTNKITLEEQKGFPHHLLGNISPNVEFTSKDFRDAAIPIIDKILLLNQLPVICSFLMIGTKDIMDDVGDSSLPEDRQADCKYELGNDGSMNNYNLLRELD